MAQTMQDIIKEVLDQLLEEGYLPSAFTNNLYFAQEIAKKLEEEGYKKEEI